MFGSKASGRRSVQVFRLLSNLFVARPGLVKKIQRVLDLHQHTFDLLPLVGTRTSIALFVELLLLREELGDCRHVGDPIIRNNLPTRFFTRRFSSVSVPPKLRQASASGPIGHFGATGCKVRVSMAG